MSHTSITHCDVCKLEASTPMSVYGREEPPIVPDWARISILKANGAKGGQYDVCADCFKRLNYELTGAEV